MDNLMSLVPCLAGVGIVGLLAIVAIVVGGAAYRRGVRDGTEFGLRVSK